jgi:hypothetical protein
VDKYFPVSEEEREHYGIYAIKRKDTDEIIYIGMTTRSFAERCNEHNETFKEDKDDKGMVLYKKMRAFKEIGIDTYFIPLLDVKEDIKVKGELSVRDLEAMELALISLYKPMGNL